MAKHNKWSKVKHRKAVVDKRRGKVWTKISKAIIVAAKNGGPDPASNLSLRYAMDEARYANMPRDTVERAIKKGAGGEDTSTFESIRYEGYAPGAVAIIVDALTDNRTRTITDVRNAFADAGGSVGASGCVAYLFRHAGVIEVAARGATEERVMEAALEAGADDVQAPDEGDEEGTWTVITPAARLEAAKAAIERAGLAIAEAKLDMIPETTARVAGEQAKGVIELIDALEELDDVQHVYTNADIDAPPE